MNCPVCKKSSVKKERPYINSFWPGINVFNERTVLRCADCGVGIIDRDFTEEFLEDFYTHHYRAVGNPHYIDFARLDGRTANSRSLSQMELAARFVKLERGDCFLDVGPGGGHSFVAAERQFPGVQKVAIELTKDAPAIYSRLYGATTFRDSASFLSEAGRAKLILVSHCLEHINPSALQDFLGELKSMLGQDGIAVVEVPHADLYLQRRYYVQDAPHCVFFSLESLRRLFAENGWEVLFADTAGRRMKEHFVRRTDGPLFSKVRARAANFTKRIFAGANRWWKKTARKKGWMMESNFKYGGERLVLRLVATPLKNHE